MPAIFISYRRDDTEGEAGRLFQDLRASFGADRVFMDVATIEPGVDFRRAIEKNTAACGVLLALIGRDWLSVVDTEGGRRLDNPDDFVRLETAAALRRDIPVIPVLVQGARMPRAADLPPELKDLAYRNSVELTHARWDSDVQLLIKALSAFSVPAPMQGPEKSGSGNVVTSTATQAGRRNWALPAAAVGAVALALALAFAVGGWTLLSGRPSTPVVAAPAPLAAATPAPMASAGPGPSAATGPAARPAPPAPNPTVLATKPDQADAALISQAEEKRKDEARAKLLAKRRAEEKLRLEAERIELNEIAEKAKADADAVARAKELADAKAKAQAEADADADARVRAEAAARARADYDAKLRAHRDGICVSGFVWREAGPGDKVCVVPQMRARAADENRQAAANRQPGGGAYGPNTCKQGFVWREAFASDAVCVVPTSRQIAAADNAAAAGRVVPLPRRP